MPVMKFNLPTQAELNSLSRRADRYFDMNESRCLRDDELMDLLHSYNDMVRHANVLYAVWRAMRKVVGKHTVSEEIYPEAERIMGHG